MKTIGKKWPRSAPRGDFVAMCDYCGAHFRRSQMVKDHAGFLRCPQDNDGGRDVVTLAEETAVAAMQYEDVGVDRWDGGHYIKP